MPETPPNAQRLAAAFLDAAGPRAPASAQPRREAAPPADLGERLVALLGAARAAYPEVQLDDAVFVRHLARHLPEGAALSTWLDLICAADLYLACACAAGVPAAVAALDRQYRAQVGAFLARRQPTPELVDDVAQAVLERLFTGAEASPPRIAEYTGRGALSAWLRVVTLRVAANLRRKRTEELAPDREDELPEPLPDRPEDPEGELLKQRCSGPYRAAVVAAVGALAAEQRDILRLHFVEGMTLEQLARKLGVGRATVARRLAAAREEIQSRARRELGGSLGLRPDEVESLMKMMRSRLDLSLSSAFPRPG
jgi:RNA polymerase sigma-70 factor, ECF subfamily